MSLVGKKAPEFSAWAVANGADFIEEFSLEQYIGEKYVVFFFYPLDFTFVCPTEIIAFQNKLHEFEKRNCAVVGCSVDSQYSHWAWLQTPRNKGGIHGVTFPLVADLDKTISENYGVLAGHYEYNEEGLMEFHGIPQAYRGLFLLNKEGIIKHCVINDMPLGRSVDETLRMLDAVIYNEENGEVCPADWTKDKEALVDTFEGVSDYLARH